MGSELDVTPSISTIYSISTTRKYSPLFPVSEGGAFQIISNDFPRGVVVLEGSCPSNRGDCIQGQLSYRGNGQLGLVVLVGIDRRGSCHSG